MIRYFDFLANRVVGELLPKVKKALSQEDAPAKQVTFRSLSQGLLNTDPLACILCGGRMVYRRAVKGRRVGELVNNAQAIARMEYVM